MTEEKRSVEHTAYPRGSKWGLLGLLCLAFFFHQGDRAIYGVVATEIQADLQLSKSEVGLVGAILFWTVAVMTPFAGYLGDMLRKKVMITGALLFWSSTTALTGLSTGFFSLAMLRSVTTGGSESFIPWRQDLTTESLVFKDGYFELPNRPGLEIDLNEKALADHPYRPRPLRHYRGDLTDIRPPDAGIDDRGNGQRSDVVCFPRQAEWTGCGHDVRWHGAAVQHIGS